MPRDRDPVGQPGHAAGVAVALRRAAHLGQHAARHLEQVAAGSSAPRERAQVEQQRARRVRHVGHVGGAAGEPPHEVAVDGAEARARRARRARAAPSTWSSSQASLVPEKYGIEHQAGRARGTRASWPAALSSRAASAVRRSCQTIALCSGLPVARSHTSVVSRWLVMPIAGDLARRRRSARASASPSAPVTDCPDLLGVVLDPARLREVLRELAVAARAQLERLVEHEHRRAGGALVDGDDEACHGPPPCRCSGQEPVGHRGEHFIPFEVERDHVVSTRAGSSLAYSLVPSRCATASMHANGTVWSCVEWANSVGVRTSPSLSRR